MKTKFLINGYVFSMIILVLISLAGMSIGLMLMIKDEPKWYIGVIEFSVPVSVVLVTLVWNAYEFYGILTIGEDYLQVSAFPRRSYRLYFRDIHYLGIDYAPLEGRKQFWIYFSVDRIEPKYLHNMIKLPFRRNTIKVVYRKDIYQTLYVSLPPDLRRKLERSSTILRIYDVDEE